MAPFFYFTDLTTETITQEWIDRLGLRHAFQHGVGISSRMQTQGPRGKGGVLFANRDQVQRGESKFGYWPERQEVFAIPDEEDNPSGVWIVYDKESLPTPESLAYKNRLPGVDVKLGGQVWHVPIIRNYLEEEGYFGITLPQKTRRRGDGKYILCGVLAEYATIYQESVQIFDCLLDDLHENASQAEGVTFLRTTEPLPLEDMIDHVCHLIGLNYSVDVWEGSLLGFADGSDHVAALHAAFDFDAFLEPLKKKVSEIAQEAMASLSPGAEESTPPTDQASAS